jgi:hypothetical protein
MKRHNAAILEDTGLSGGDAVLWGGHSALKTL